MTPRLHFDRFSFDMEQFDRLVAIVARLRAPDGCPWDRAQDHVSLKPYLIEEAYEVLAAIDAADRGKSDMAGKLGEELGDLLLHIVFHAQLEAEKGRFTMEDVCRMISDKLIQRHPHVFNQQIKLTPSEVLDRWEVLKREAGTEYSVLQGVPKTLPALLKAYRVQEKVGRLGFDWKHPAEVVEKIKEEVAEFEDAFRQGDAKTLRSELGDLLFTLVNLSRHLGLNAEEALNETSQRFIRRFQWVEKKLAEAGKTPAQASLEEMDALWDEAKFAGD